MIYKRIQTSAMKMPNKTLTFFRFPQNSSLCYFRKRRSDRKGLGMPLISLTVYIYLYNRATSFEFQKQNYINRLSYICNSIRYNIFI